MYFKIPSIAYTPTLTFVQSFLPVFILTGSMSKGEPRSLYDMRRPDISETGSCECKSNCLPSCLHRSHWSRPVSYPVSWRHLLLKPTHWLADGQKRRKKNNQTSSAAAEMFYSKTGNSWADWHPSWSQDVFSLGSSETTFAVDRSSGWDSDLSVFPKQRNCLSVPKECSRPVVALLYPTQRNFSCLCIAFSTGKGQSSFPGCKNLNPLWTGLRVSCSSVGLLFS